MGGSCSPFSAGTDAGGLQSRNCYRLCCCRSRRTVEDLLHGSCLPQTVAFRRNQASVKLVCNRAQRLAVRPKLPNQPDDRLFPGTFLKSAVYQHIAEGNLPLAPIVVVPAPFFVETKATNGGQHARMAHIQHPGDLPRRQALFGIHRIGLFFLGGDRRLPNFRNREGPADLPGESIGDFRMSWDRFNGSSLRVHPQGMRVAFTFEHTAVEPQMPEQCVPFHEMLMIS